MLQYVFEALYTPQLIQKRKKWHDGKCLYFGGTKKLILVEEEGRIMAERFWSGEDVPETGTTIQLDRYLVQLDSLLRIVEKAPPDAPSSTNVKPTGKHQTRPSKATLGRPLSDVLHDVSMNLKPLGSGPIERRVKRVKADKFGGLSPALLGRTETTQFEPSDNVKREDSNPEPYPQTSNDKSAYTKPRGFESASLTTLPSLGLAQDTRPTRSNVTMEMGELGNNETASSTRTANYDRDTIFFENEEVSANHDPEFTQQDHNESDLFVGDPFDTLVHDKIELSPEFDSAGGIEVGELPHEVGFSAVDQAEQDSDDLFSDTDVEVLQISDTPRVRRSLFEDMPDECPVAGPWTKEAYLLFSWHPPQPKVKQEAPV